MKVLQIDSSILGEHSVSRQLSAAIVARLKEHDSALTLTYRDLAADPLPHMAFTNFAPSHPHGAPATDAKDDPRAASQKALDEFLAADVVVIGAPMYNFTISTQLKAWVDRILVAGKTFAYTPQGPNGLAKGKRIIIGVARGGDYGKGAAAESSEHAESYLKSVFAFIGISDVEFIVAEKIAFSPEHKAEATKNGVAAAGQLKARAQA